MISTFDSTPLTREWLAEIGFKPVQSDMGPDYDDHMERDGLNLWEFNDPTDWRWNDCDRIAIRTRGKLAQLASFLEIELLKL